MDVLELKRGDIYMADLDGSKGSEQGKTRPVLIVQNDIGNKYSPTTIVTVLTSQLHKCKLPTHVIVTAHNTGLQYDSVAMLEQLRTVDKKCRLLNKVGHIPEYIMSKIDRALKVSVGVNEEESFDKKKELLLLKIGFMEYKMQYEEDEVERLNSKYEWRKYLFELKELCKKNKVSLTNYYDKDKYYRLLKAG